MLLISAQAGRLQLKAVEKGVPAAVRSAYMSIILIIILFFIPILLITGGLAFGLIFAPAGDVHATISSLTLGFCCLDLILLLLVGLLFILKKPITSSIEAMITNSILDNMEQKQRDAAEKERIQDIEQEAQASDGNITDTEATEIFKVSRDEPTYNTSKRP